jgi:hypothetical protein
MSPSRSHAVGPAYEAGLVAKRVHASPLSPSAASTTDATAGWAVPYRGASHGQGCPSGQSADEFRRAVWQPQDLPGRGRMCWTTARAFCFTSSGFPTVPESWVADAGHGRRTPRRWPRPVLLHSVGDRECPAGAENSGAVLPYAGDPDTPGVRGLRQPETWRSFRRAGSPSGNRCRWRPGKATLVPKR